MTNDNRRSLLMILAIGVIVSGWILIAKLLIPPIIELAYRGQASSILSDLLPRRHVRPLDHYLARCEAISMTVSVLLLLGGLGLVVASRPGFQRFMTRSRHSPENTQIRLADCVPPNRLRLLVVNTVIVVIIGGHLFDIITLTEHWPFSHYGMFSGLAPRTLSAQLRLYGVSSVGDVSLNAPQYLAPFDEQRFKGAIRKMMRGPNAQDAIDRALQYAFYRYEHNRLIGTHQGPPLRAIKVVEASWERDEWARNTDSPDLRVLYEIRPAERRGLRP